MDKIELPKKLKKAIIYIIFLCNFFILFAYLPFYREFDLYKTDGSNYQLSRFDNIYLPRLHILSISIFILLLIFLYIIIKSDKTIESNVFNYLILALFVLFSLSTYFAVDRYTALNGRIYRWEGFISLGSYLFLAFLTANFVEELKDFKNYAYLIWGSAVILSLYGLMQFFGFDFIKRDPIRENWYRAFATFGNPNFAASFAVLVLPSFMLLYLALKKEKYKLLAFFSSGLIYAFLLATVTRGSWLAFSITAVIALFILFDFLKTKKRELIKLLLFFLLITIFINFFHGGVVSSRFLSIFGDFYDLSSRDEDVIDHVGSSRIFIYRNSLPLMLENPLLGVGPDNFAEIFPQADFQDFKGSQRQIVDKAHSEYIQLGVTTGLPALFLYLALIAYILFKLKPKSFKNIDLSREKDLKKFIKSSLFFAVTAYVLQAALNISVITVAPIFWTVLGFAGAYIRKIENFEEGAG